MKQVTNASQTFKQFIAEKKVTRTNTGRLVNRIQSDPHFPDNITTWREYQEYLYPTTLATKIPNHARNLWWDYVGTMKKDIIINNG